MKKIFGIFILFGSFGCGEQVDNHLTESKEKDSVLISHSEPNDSAKIENIDVETIQYEQLLARVASTSDTLYVVNFWATWCKPCIAELPDIFQWYDSMKGKKVAYLMVSLDTKDNLTQGVIPFLKSNKYYAEHYLLDDNGRMNVWIPKINNKWEGDIPATAFYQKGKQVSFVNGTIHTQTLNDIAQEFLK